MGLTTQETTIAAAIGKTVEAGHLAGAATLIWRDGAIETTCVGWRDIEAKLPIERDTIFRIASMTKPITSTAALMLLEEGRFALDDPITRWAPEFATMRVLRSTSGPLDETVPAERPITFDDLLTHRSGLTYGPFWPGPLARAYEEALGGDIDTDVVPDEWIARLATLPLIDQPGATLHYGQSTDLLGLLLARIEGISLGELLARRIFRPLGMKDTAFTVPPEQRERRAAPYGFDDAGRLTKRTVGPGHAFRAERPADMTFEGGGGGLWSTLDDYLAFARLFLGDGAVDGVRLMRPETLALMTTNRLTPAQRATADVAGWPVFAAGHGYGMGVAVVMEPERAEPSICGGGVGAVGWPGGFGGWWQADPNDQSVLIFLTHHMLEWDQFASGMGLGALRAVRAFQALASGAPRARADRPRRIS
jgi:CubicO group peptidase (beta-lactamase class C family)